MNPVFFKSFWLSSFATVFFVACDVQPSNVGDCFEYESGAQASTLSLAKPATSCLPPPPWYPWKKQPPAAYSFTYTRSCFCLREDKGPFRVTVENGVVASALYRTSEGDTVAAAGSLQSYALDSIWNVVNGYRAQPYHSLFVHHDSTWGYPDSFFVDQSLLMQDDEYGVTITDFTVLQE